MVDGKQLTNNNDENNNNNKCKIKFTTAWSRESANAFDDETSKCKPTAAAVCNKGSSISLVGVG